MENIINIAEMVFFLWGAIWGYLFYTGQLKYSGEQEEIRKKKVKKYKWLMIICIIVLAISGLGMLMVTLTKLLKYAT